MFMGEGLVRPWGLVLPDLCLSAVTASTPSALQHSGKSDNHRLAFEPIQNNPLVFLTENIIFLVAITSACRVSEFVTLTCKEPFLVIHHGDLVASDDLFA